MTVTQADSFAANEFGHLMCAVCEYERIGALVQAFATHRQAALLDGIRLGIEAARAVTLRCIDAIHIRSNRDAAELVVALNADKIIVAWQQETDPATILAEHEKNE